MSKQILLNADHILGPWIAKRCGAQYIHGAAKCIGLVDDGRIIAGAMFEAFNGANLSMHIAAEPGSRWLSRDFLWICFDYPFNQQGVRRVTGVVPSCNAAARRFDEHLGFTLEATLRDAHPQGDLLIYSMHRADCRWLNLRKPPHVTRKQESGGVVSLPQHTADAFAHGVPPADAARH